MLRRVLKHADTKTRQISYLSFSVPAFEYKCVVWDPHLKKDNKRFERIQSMARWFVLELMDMLVSPIYGTKLALKICLFEGRI